MPKILIVDDEKKFRDMYKKLFKAEKIEIVEASDGLDAANILMRDANSLDLILLDINMPEMDGCDIYKMVKEYTNKIPIVISSMYPINDQKLKIPNAREYFSKNQNIEVLRKKVNEILGI